MKRSSATREDIELYCHGMCHVFAIALHRRFGWTLLVVLDLEERYWQDPFDADNSIAAAVHVYAVDEELNAWDVLGVRSLSEAKSEQMDIDGCDSDEVRSEMELKRYVGHWGEGEDPIDRPLVDYNDEDVISADAAALRVLGHLSGFPFPAEGLSKS